MANYLHFMAPVLQVNCKLVLKDLRATNRGRIRCDSIK